MLDGEALGGVMPGAPLTFCLPCPAAKEASDLILTLHISKRFLVYPIIAFLYQKNPLWSEHASSLKRLISNASGEVLIALSGSPGPSSVLLANKNVFLI